MKKRKVHIRKRLKYIMNDVSYLMAVILLASIAAMDSDNLLIPFTGLLISGGWLAFHGMVLDAKSRARERRCAR